ncbi:MAG: serine protein kinase PrkA, partial [Candidatus Blackburnbacteria bacterium]|nr:serine protein kinase PrkA [Candidatus Blackburnbacteria bacterium]
EKGQVHVAPYTLELAAIFAVLTRLEEGTLDEGKRKVGILQKLKLYNGREIDGLTPKDAQDLHERAKREGMDGVSPRYVINRLSSAIVKDGGSSCINPIDALRSLRDGLEQHTSATAEERERYMNLIFEARKEFDEIAKREVQKAFVYSFEESAKTLFESYLDNIEAYCNKTKLKDPITQEDMDPNEKLIRSIEEQIGVAESAKKTFREEVLIRISSLVRRGRPVNYSSHPPLEKAIEKKLFADLHDLVKTTLGTKTPDAEQQKRVNEAVQRLVQERSYCQACAAELLRYVGTLLNK